MPKKAISVTLTPENLLWLRGQAHGPAVRSVSEVLDRLVSTARKGGQVDGASIRSVVGTVRIAGADPDLQGADATIRRLFPGAGRRRVRR